VFEGCRRIARLLQCIWIIGCLVVFWNQRPFARLVYETEGPDRSFVRQNTTWCSEGDEAQLIENYRFESDRTVEILLCFKAQPFPVDRMLIPYKIDRVKNLWWGGYSWEDDVRTYMNGRVKRFTLEPESQGTATVLWRKERWNQFCLAVAYAIGGFIFVSVAAALIGWIVRGFLGIPLGHDSRPEPPTTAPAQPSTNS
jgi:hypothetical protein